MEEEIFMVVKREEAWAVTGKAAIRYGLSDRVNAYASYTRGYKGPTVDLPSSGLLSTIDPETSD